MMSFDHYIQFNEHEVQRLLKPANGSALINSSSADISNTRQLHSVGDRQAVALASQLLPSFLFTVARV